jgi:hypothetical protein
MLNFSDTDQAKMMSLQQELAVVLRRANDQKLEAAVAAFACLRLARLLIDKYPETTRMALAELCAAFLRHDKMQDEGGSDLLVM